MSQSLIKEFFSKFAPLTKLQKKFFMFLQWCFKKWPAVFAKHKYWADEIGCTRKSILHMLKKFFNYGWISWTSRGNWNTNLYSLSPGIIDLDLINGQRFTRDKVTPEVTPNLSNRFKNTGKMGTGACHPQFEYRKKASQERTITIPERIDRLNLSYDIKLKLSMVPEYYFQSALDLAKWRKSKGFQIDKPNEYVAGSAIKMAMEKGIRLDWPAFYNSMKNYNEGVPT